MRVMRPLLLPLLLLQLQLQFLLQGRSRRRWKSFVEVDLGDVAYAGNATDDVTDDATDGATDGAIRG